MNQNVGLKKNAPDVKLERKEGHRKQVKNTKKESMVFVKDGKQKKKTWVITEYKDGSVSKRLEKIEVV